VELKPESGLPATAFGPPVQEKPEHPSVLAKVDRARREAETQAIVAALNATLWNRKQAALLLNIDYKALLYKMKKLGIGEKWTGATSGGNGAE
jgi:DNA-binding NtrC family response regulator